MAVSTRTWFVAFSLLVHGGFAIGIGEIEIQKSHAATAIEIAEVKKKEPPKPEPAKVDPEPPKVDRQPRSARPKPAAEPEATPPPAPVTGPIDALPDFGVSLSGGVEGTGIALPSGGSTRLPRDSAPAQPRKLSAAIPKPLGDECAEDATKPKPLSVPQPAYTDQARIADIEGKVRVQLTVDETGHVVDVKLLQGLGYGLDEAALAAARQAAFEPARRCGKPTRATFNISMRFGLR